MQLRTGLFAILALIFSVSAASGVYLFARRPAPKPEVEMVPVVVATAQVARGVTLTEAMLETRPWPQDYVPEGTLQQVEEAVGRTVWIPLVPKDPIVESKLATKGAGRGMASLIPRGMRAITIQTPNVATGVAGFILPGNKVDVLWTLSQSSRNDLTGGGSTATLLQNIEILAVDQQIEMPQENKVDPRDLRSVTLLVTPQDAAKLDLAQNRGTLRLALRNPEDSLTDPIETSTLASMRLPASQQSETDTFADSVALDSDELDEPFVEDLVDARYRGEVAEPAATIPAEVLLPIRTLRGTSSGAVRLRQPAATERYHGTPYGGTGQRP